MFFCLFFVVFFMCTFSEVPGSLSCFLTSMQVPYWFVCLALFTQHYWAQFPLFNVSLFPSSVLRFCWVSGRRMDHLAWGIIPGGFRISVSFFVCLFSSV